MSFLHPIEATTTRINDIPVSNGNCIFDITKKKIFYDTHTGERIEISGFEFFDTETALLASIGIEDRIYIAKDTKAMYCYENSSWKLLQGGSGGNSSISTFYLSETGDDNNSGTSQDSPMKTIKGLFEKYPSNTIFNITISGNIPASDVDVTGNLTIQNKIIYIYGTNKDTDKINDKFLFINCFVYLSNIACSQIAAQYGASVTLKSCDIINDVLFYFNTQASLDNCNIHGNLTTSNNCDILIDTSIIEGNITSQLGTNAFLKNSIYGGELKNNDGRIYIDSTVDMNLEDIISSHASTIDILDAEPTDPKVGYMYIVNT